VVTWVAKLFQKSPRPNLGVAGFVPGRLFDPGALRAAYVTSQHKPWYSVIGPGARVFGQLQVSQPATVLMSQTLQTLPTTGLGGVNAGTYLQQGLSLPPSLTTGNQGQTANNAGNI